MLTSQTLTNILGQLAGGGEGGLMSLLPILLMFVILYFLMIRPQMKRQKEHKNMVSALAKGDEIVTNGGLLGKVAQVTETTITVEIARNGDTPVEVLVQRSAVQTVLPKGTIKAL
jgi:preprotein translocase subunit YajC